MSFPTSLNDEQTKKLSQPNKNKHFNNTLPFSQPVLQNNDDKNLQLIKNQIPKIDSAILFQSNDLLNENEEFDSSISMSKTASSQIPLISFANDSNFLTDNGSIEQYNSIIKLSKTRKFTSGIKINYYFNDLFRREIKAPHLQTREELFSFVEPYSIENYAKTHFRKQIGIIFFTNQSIKELTTFSIKPPSKPLLEKTPVTKKDSVSRLVTHLFYFIGVLSDEKQDQYYKGREDELKENLTISIVNILKEDDSLIDEFYMQLIKTMRGSPSEESLLFSWKLFLTISTIFFVKDSEVSNVIRWFLIHNLFEDNIFGEYANYSFIRFYERNVLERHFDSSMTKNDIVRIPLGVRYGIKMFKCSLYMQLWNQKREFPNLPIPLTVYLVVKTLIKNGVFVTPNPFPDLGEAPRKNSSSKSSANMSAKNADDKDGSNEGNRLKDSQTGSSSIKVESINYNSIKEDQRRNKQLADINQDKKEEQTDEDKPIGNDANQCNSIDRKDTVNESLADSVKNNENSTKSDKSGSNSGGSSGRFNTDGSNCYRKAEMATVKMWAAKLNGDHSIINDGEVANLLALLLIWMINLLDPIVPKCMASSFVDTFTNTDDSSYKEKCQEFVENLPLFHKNTLKYLIGFLREIAKNEKFTHETHQTIAETLGFYFVRTSFITIDPFTRKEMTEVSPNFLLYCLDNLDVKDIYPLNPAYEVVSKEDEEEEDEEENF
ncbi:Rho GTPase activating protein 39 [Tritrichomonas musculus]|uniref:Rho GTPase activating protein 39 n=1 Tax=Tritrichomonas musculus TaxID=1915356 RepID=A0ABR2IQE1_9EUKA